MSNYRGKTLIFSLNVDKGFFCFQVLSSSYSKLQRLWIIEINFEAKQKFARKTSHANRPTLYLSLSHICLTLKEIAPHEAREGKSQRNVKDQRTRFISINPFESCATPSLLHGEYSFCFHHFVITFNAFLRRCSDFP